jgi:hypothetical protein
MTELKIEHVLILVIAAFALYHFMVDGVKCSCMRNRDGFSVGGDDVCHFKYTSVQPFNGECADPTCEKYSEDVCSTKYYSRPVVKNNEKVLKNFWCRFKGDKCSGSNEEVVHEPESSACPTCDNIFKLPNEVNTIKYSPECFPAFPPNEEDTCKKQFGETDVVCSPAPELDCVNDPISIKLKTDGTPDDTKCKILKDKADKLHDKDSFLGCINEAPLYNDIPLEYNEDGTPIYDNKEELFMSTKQQWGCYSYLQQLVFNYLKKHNMNSKDMTKKDYEDLISTNYNDLSLLFGCDKKALIGFYYNNVIG